MFSIGSLSNKRPRPSSRLYTTTPPTLARFNWRLRHSPKTRPSESEPNVVAGYVKRIRPTAVGLTAGHPLYRPLQAYEQKFLPALEAEKQEEEKVFKERLATWSLTRLKEEGYCLTDLSAHWMSGNRLGRPVASFRRSAGLPLSDSDNRFMHGSQILLSRLDPLREPVSYRGSVTSRTATHMSVSFSETFKLDEGKWRMDLGYSEIAYTRMKDAVGSLHLDPASQEQIVTETDREVMLQGTYLRAPLLQSFSGTGQGPHEETSATSGIFADDMRIQSWARRYAKPNPVIVEGDPIVSGLNSVQIMAMATMIGERLSVIQGPPGTGKTRTIIETIKLLKTTFQIPHPILVCTYTNVAVDNLVEGFGRSGLKPLRVAFGARVKDSLKAYTLDHNIDTHPLRSAVEEIALEVDKLRAEAQAANSKLLELHGKREDGFAANKRTALQRRLTAIEKRTAVLNGQRYRLQQTILRDLVSKADVICTTSLTSACAALSVSDFPIVFIDEASMSTEPASLVPLMKGSRHAALIGDHKQLPPIITSTEAREMDLGISLFERLKEENVVPSVMLNVQYRMHPAISDFPNFEFYGESVTNGTVNVSGAVSSSLKPPTSQHLSLNHHTGARPSVIFLDHAGSESVKDRSRVNANEAHIIASVVEDLLLKNPELMGSDIGIIAPYVAQISLLTRMFNVDPKFKRRFSEVLGDQRALQIGLIEIKTVDGFEGREKAIIIFSTVRNNRGGSIGFLADQRRLNVGLTRAKRGLFVVGSIATLRESRIRPENDIREMTGKGAASWRRYAEYLTEMGLVVSLVGPRLHSALYGNIPTKAIS